MTTYYIVFAVVVFLLTMIFLGVLREKIAQKGWHLFLSISAAYFVVSVGAFVISFFAAAIPAGIAGYEYASTETTKMMQETTSSSAPKSTIATRNYGGLVSEADLKMPNSVFLEDTTKGRSIAIEAADEFLIPSPYDWQWYQVSDKTSTLDFFTFYKTIFGNFHYTKEDGYSGDQPIVVYTKSGDLYLVRYYTNNGPSLQAQPFWFYTGREIPIVRYSAAIFLCPRLFLFPKIEN